MKLTEEQFSAAYEGYALIHEAAEDTAELWISIFGECNEYIEKMTIDETSIDIETEISRCSCCGPDREYHSIPISYLWDEDWQERETKRQAGKKQKEEEAAAKREEERKAAQEKKRREDYLKLKEEFEGK